MNYLKWDDFNPKDYEDMYEMFKSTFYRLYLIETYIRS